MRNVVIVQQKMYQIFKLSCGGNFKYQNSSLLFKSQFQAILKIKDLEVT